MGAGRTAVVFPRRLDRKTLTPTLSHRRPLHNPGLVARKTPHRMPVGTPASASPPGERPLQNPGAGWIVATSSTIAESLGYAPVHPSARTARRLAAAAGRAQRPPGAADRAHRLGAAGRAGGGPARRAGGAAQLSAAADGEGAVVAAVVPGLGPGDGRGLVGAPVVPPLRGVGAAGRRAGSLHDQPLPHAIDDGGPGRAAVRGRGRATGRPTGAGPAGHAGGRHVGGRGGAPPAGRRDGGGQPPRPGRRLGPPGAAGALRVQAAPGRGRRLGTGAAGGADAGERKRDRGGGPVDRRRRGGPCTAMRPTARTRAAPGCGTWGSRTG